MQLAARMSRLGTESAFEVLARAKSAGLPARIVGRTGGDALVLDGEATLPLADLRAAHEGWLPAYMSRAVT